MSALPYYLALFLLICVMGVWGGLMLDLFGMRYWMHHVTDFLETQFKGPEAP